MSAACRILFIRHAETDLAGTFCGHSDPPVNARGLDQIRALLELIRNKPIEVLYTSDLQRAVITAEAIGKAHGVTPIHESRLREINFGDWEGLSWDEVEQRDSVCAQRWIDEYPNLPAPHGERFEAFQTRVLATIDHLHPVARHGLIAVVTHAGVMRVVLESLHCPGQESWAITKPYCSFFEYAEVPATPVQRGASMYIS